MPEIYYDEPFQVLYIKPDTSLEYAKGLAFHDWIIDYQTGKPYKVKDILINADALKVELDKIIIEFCDWKELRD